MTVAVGKHAAQQEVSTEREDIAGGRRPVPSPEAGAVAGVAGRGGRR